MSENSGRPPGFCSQQRRMSSATEGCVPSGSAGRRASTTTERTCSETARTRLGLGWRLPRRALRAEPGGAVRRARAAAGGASSLNGVLEVHSSHMTMPKLRPRVGFGQVFRIQVFGQRSAAFATAGRTSARRTDSGGRRRACRRPPCARTDCGRSPPAPSSGRSPSRASCPWAPSSRSGAPGRSRTLRASASRGARAASSACARGLPAAAPATVRGARL